MLLKRNNVCSWKYSRERLEICEKNVSCVHEKSEKLEGGGSENNSKNRNGAYGLRNMRKYRI